MRTVETETPALPSMAGRSAWGWSWEWLAARLDQQTVAVTIGDTTVKLKLDCGIVVVELTTAPGESLGDALDAVLSRTEGLSRLFQAIDELDGGELTLTPASPSTEDIFASDDTLEAVDWIVEKGSADPAGMEPGRMGRLEYDRDQVIKLWQASSSVVCAWRRESRWQCSCPSWQPGAILSVRTWIWPRR